MRYIHLLGLVFCVLDVLKVKKANAVIIQNLNSRTQHIIFLDAQPVCLIDLVHGIAHVNRFGDDLPVPDELFLIKMVENNNDLKVVSDIVLDLGIVLLQ